MKQYRGLTTAIVEELKGIVGPNNVIYQNHDEMQKYSHDEVADRAYAHMPDVVVKPGSSMEISSIIKLANRELIPVTPRGAGSGLSGGAVPSLGGILLSLERMNKILEVDKKNLMAVLQPGVVTSDFNKALEADGLFFAGYPMSEEVCFIGGNVAENAGGSRAIKYGVTGHHITGLEVVLPTGEICTFGGKRAKDVTGYNIVQLMVGSEGTLGIFTKIIIKLLPLPKAKIDMVALFEDVQSAIDIVPLIMINERITPTSVEFIDKLSLDTASDYLGVSKWHKGSSAALIIELDGDDPGKVLEKCLDIGELCLEHGAVDAFIAEGSADREKIWQVRRAIADAFNAISKEQSLEDVVVPVSNIPALIPILDKLSEKHNVLIPCYGHAGDGNMHVTIIKKPEQGIEQWEKILPCILCDLYTAVKDLGGTISGEHGIGSKRKQFLHLVLTPEEIEVMKKIKQALDPNNILNPKKIFD